MATNTVYALMFSLDTSDGERWELILYQGEGIGELVDYAFADETGKLRIEGNTLQGLAEHALTLYRRSNVTARQVGHASFPNRSMSDVRKMVQRDYGALCISTCDPEDGECVLGFVGSNPDYTERLTEEAKFLVEELRFALAPVYS